jgi:cell wall-associated NlpC family hydrolase
MHAISKLSIIPVRKDPSDRSEMVTQILFGETFEVLESAGSWSKIKADYDWYTGWVDTKQITKLDDEETKKLMDNPVSISQDLIQLVIDGKEMIPVVLGSTLPFYYGKKFFIGEKEFTFDGSVKTITSPDAKGIPENAFMYLNAPYMWGGRSPLGLDCSGFTQMVFKLSGIKLLRDAIEQAGQGKKISFEDAKAGDLAFFKNEDQKIVHVGIVLDNNRIIHSSGKVRVDKLDEEGIFNEETGKHSHKLAVIRRIS